MKLRVFASLADDINNGWVWVPENVVVQRNVIKLQNLDSGKTVFCEALQIGENFISRYNDAEKTFRITDKDKAIVINEWYRNKLGITKTQQEHGFKITVTDNPWGHIRASLHHPQIVVRISIELAILGVLLGVFGMLF